MEEQLEANRKEIRIKAEGQRYIEPTTAAVNPVFSWPLAKMVTSPLLLPGEVRPRITHQPLQPAVSIALFSWCLFPWRPLTLCLCRYLWVTSLTLQAGIRGESAVCCLPCLHSISLISLPVGASSHFRSLLCLRSHFLSSFLHAAYSSVWL